MTTLQRDPQAAPAAEGPPPSAQQPEPVLSHPCEVCGAGMRADQDWCLECGTAAPGRLGARPGWRAAFTVVGLTTLLLTGAVTASYAALTGDAERDASRPSAGAGEPIVAQTPGVAQGAKPVAPGATGPGTTAPKPRPVKPPALPSSPSRGVTNTPLGGSKSSSSGSSSAANSGSSSSPSSAPTAVDLARATTYDPEKRIGAEFGPAKNAVDASKKSVWDVTVPVDNAPIGAGLVIDLGARHSLQSLTIETPTPGFDVELYGSASTKVPAKLLDSSWKHLTDRKAYDGSSITLKGRGKGTVRYIDLWFTKAAAPEDPRIAVANVTVTASK